MTTVLNFYVGDAAYGMPIEYVLEVIPAIAAEAVDIEVLGFVGTFLFRGIHVPLFDFCLAKTGVPAKQVLSTRIIVVEWNSRIVGLLAERVIELSDISGDNSSACMMVLPSDIIPEPILDRGLHEA